MRAHAAAAALLAGGLALSVAGTADASTGSSAAVAARVAQIRAATARFHNIATAEENGYVLFHDVKGISCIAMPGMGAMGVHLVNPKLIADPAIDPRKPEALVYAPAADGTLHLAAMEYLVVQKAWKAGHSAKPRLFAGKDFNATGAGSRFGLPPFYSEHVWVWRHNPAGMLSMWNPAVHC